MTNALATHSNFLVSLAMIAIAVASGFLLGRTLRDDQLNPLLKISFVLSLLMVALVGVYGLTLFITPR